MRRGLQKLGMAMGLLAAVAGCRCDPGIDTLKPDFRVTTDTQALEFGRVLEGERVTKSVVVVAENRAAIRVLATVEAPFQAPRVLDVPGGDQAELPVTFVAGDGEATGRLVLKGGDRTVEVNLHGTGVRPLVCTPSGPCIISTYSLEEDRCVETVAADDTSCDPGNVCLEQGRCRGGLCLGVSRGCGDNNACTVDGCSMQTGCVNVPRTCPAPANPCEVPTCDPVMGCGTANATDGTQCGPADCVTGLFCLSGQCVTLDTPEGFPCGIAVACMPQGQCMNQRCVRPDAGPWLPRWSARVPGSPSAELPTLLASGGNLFFSTCGLPRPDAGVDGGTDGGVSDAGTPDAGLPDAGEVDGGEVDGGEADAGQIDGGDLDGGDLDAGPLDDGGVCALASWTSSGFDRFVTPYEDEAPRRLLNLSPRGVLLAVDGGLELRSRATGAWLDGVEAKVAPDAVAVSTDSTIRLLLDDGTLANWGDAGLVPVVALGNSGVLALDRSGALYAFDPDAGVLSRVVLEDDGGITVSALWPDAGPARSLVASGNDVLAGGRTQVRWLSDGGFESVDLTWVSPAGVVLEPAPRGVLMAAESAVVFSRRCPDPLTSCLVVDQEMWVRATHAQTGLTQWEAKVLPGGVASKVSEAALVSSAMAPGAVAMLVEADFTDLDAGVGAFLQIFAQGQRALLCPLPERSAHVRAALFANSNLFVLADQADGGVTLEAFDLKSLPLNTSGWPQATGLDGRRRAEP